MGKLVTVSILRLKLVEATGMAGPWQHGGHRGATLGHGHFLTDGMKAWTYRSWALRPPCWYAPHCGHPVPGTLPARPFRQELYKTWDCAGCLGLRAAGCSGVSLPACGVTGNC